MASSSGAQSRMSVETFLCDCNKKAKLFTSWSQRNPGRRFMGCGQPQGTRCNFFHWFDVEVEGRHGDVITQLNNRRYFLEERVGLMEGRLSSLEDKLAAKKLQTRVLKKHNSFLARLCFVLGIALAAVIGLLFQKKDNETKAQLSLCNGRL